MAALRTGAIDNIGLIPTGTKGIQGKDKAGVPFSQYLKEALKETNNLVLDSEKLADDFAIGRTDNIHQVLIAAEKADIALQFTMQIRNKILDAYNEIMRMQI